MDRAMTITRNRGMATRTEREYENKLKPQYFSVVGARVGIPV